MTATILVQVGTDHHPFHRLVDWADSWAESHPHDTVLVQHGSSPAPRVATGYAFLAPERLAQLVDGADVVVCHGGPGTITDARAAGHLPLVLPRDPARGEHVDDHQQRFVRWAAGKGLVRAVTEVAELDQLVPAQHRTEDPTRSYGSEPVQGADAVANLTTLVETFHRGRRLPVTPGAPKVVFLGGSGRSGSTLLERLLGQVDGVEPLGEVVHLWERGVRENQLCGCGTAFWDCAFWKDVGRHAFGGWDRLDVSEVLALKHRVDRQRHILQAAARHPSAPFRRDLLAYAAYYRQVYAAAREVSGADVVVDSSKHASTAMALSHDRGIDLRTVQIIRDARGVAHSWAKEIQRPEVAEDLLMPRYSSAKSTGLWVFQNLALDGLRHRGLPLARLRYEDLVDDPEPALRATFRALDLPEEIDLDLTGRTVDLRSTHSVAGNPMRFRTGPTELRPDSGWQQEMSKARQALVLALGYPLQRRFGYRRRA